jgi:hypothetical protein
MNAAQALAVAAAALVVAGDPWTAPLAHARAEIVALVDVGEDALRGLLAPQCVGWRDWERGPPGPHAG